MPKNTLGYLGTCAAAALTVFVAGCGGGGDDADPSPVVAPSGPGANAPPTIQGQPATSVVAGQEYSFQPSASDPNGDTLTFSVVNLPVWATFNESTGRISGTPTSAEVGAYGNVTVRVSDGTHTVSLPAFSVTVSDVANGAATLSWTPPTQNTDTSTLSDLVGYDIRYGQSAANLDQAISVSNPSINTYVVGNLSSGTWYFAISAVNSQGVRSALSNVASKTIS